MTAVFRAIQADITILPSHPLIEEVIFCCFSAADLAVYQRLLQSGAGC